MYDDKNIEVLNGAKVTKIWMDEDSLTFETDKGLIAFAVEGDCCSTSVFYDFYGVDNLLKNGPITEIEDIDLEITGDDKDSDDDCVKVYGVRLTTVSDEFGPMSSVFSFRNYSNGYYGGSLIDGEPNTNAPELTEDCVSTQSRV
jgi:hypothetical protein